MKKKLWIILAVVAVLAILFVPIPTGTYKDGGTRAYTALTYKIVKWHRVTGDMAVYAQTKVYPFPLNFLSIDKLFDLENVKAPEPDSTPADPAYRNISCDFHAQYIRTDGYHEGVEYPVATVIRSVEELQTYYEKNKSLYALERRSDPASDSTIGFLDACEKYDENYFAKHALVLVLLQESSGSVRHEVKDVQFLGETEALEIEINALLPEVGTCDMAQWHILVEVSSQLDTEHGKIQIDSEMIQVVRKDVYITEPADGSCGTNNPHEVIYREGIWPDKEWDTVDFPVENDCVPDMETAIAVTSAILETFQKQGYFKDYEAQSVFYDTQDHIWFVTFAEEALTPGACFTIALRQSNGEVLKMWVGE